MENERKEQKVTVIEEIGASRRGTGTIICSIRLKEERHLLFSWDLDLASLVLFYEDKVGTQVGEFLEVRMALQGHF